MPKPKSEYLSEAWKDGLFKDKVVFCTGGNGSICSEQVRALVHLGADACIVGRSVEKTNAVAQDLATARAGSTVLGIGAIDVRNASSLQGAINTCVGKFGGIDFLIAGAAGNFLAPISQLSPNAMKTVIDIDVLGSYNAAKLAMPYLIQSCKKHNESTTLPTAESSGPGGRVIFVSATLHYLGTVLQTHAAVAKAGVDALSAQVAIEYGPFGITSNVIAPGPIGGTEGVKRLAKSGENNDFFVRSIPIGRWGSVKEIADATVFLFSDAANYITGDALVVDGGAWRVPGTGITGDFPYPDFLLSGEEVTGVAGLKTNKVSNL